MEGSVVSKIDNIAKQFADAVREAFIRVYGLPARNDYLRSVQSSWSEEGIRQGWHDPDPGVVIIGTEYGWIPDPWSTVRNEHDNWERAMDLLKKAGWDDVNFESINAAVHIVYWMPPSNWRTILNQRLRERMR